MMIIMRTDAKQVDIDSVVKLVQQNGLRAHISTGAERTVIGAIGDLRTVQKEQFLYLPGVDRVVPISRPFKLASREFKPEQSSFHLGDVTIGGQGIVIIAGPCSVESRSQMIETAQAVKEAGAHILRGGVYKPRTSPYSFQGMGVNGLEILAEARQVTGLPVVSEVMREEQIPLLSEAVDMLQVGARNMHNYALLHALGESMVPIFLKRSMMATVEELLMATEYILSHGNQRVVMCERGIRTFEDSTRNTTDINAIPVLKELTHLPVFLDPSHSTGNWSLVTAVAKAAVAAGADGIMVEVHPHPGEAFSDGGQSLKPERFFELVRQIRRIAEAVDRVVYTYSASARTVSPLAE